MKMKTIPAIFSILCLLCYSCSSSAPKDGVVTLNLADNMSPNNINEEFTLNDIFESIEIYQLEENETIGAKTPRLWGINDDGSYSFADFSNQWAVNIHDNKGKVISAFTKLGKGPGEYIYPSSIIYNGEDDLRVLNAANQKLNIYDKNGNFKSSINTPPIINMTSIGGGEYICLASGGDTTMLHNFYIIDEDGNVKDKIMPLDKTKNNMMRYNANVVKSDKYVYIPIQKFGETAYYSYDKVSKELKKICDFDLGSYDPKIEDFANPSGDFGGSIMALDLAKVGDYIFSSYWCNNYRFQDIWSLKDGKRVARRMHSFTTNERSQFTYKMKDGKEILVDTYPLFSYNDVFITTASPVYYSKHIDGIDPDGNLVVITMKLKQKQI